MSTPPNVAYPELRLFVGGEWRGAAETLPVVNPSTEAEIGRLPIATTTDLDEAHLQSIEAYKSSRPSSAIATSTLGSVRHTKQHPSSAAPIRTVLTDGLDDATHGYVNRTVYDGRVDPQSTPHLNIKTRRKPRPKTANARVVPRRNVFGARTIDPKLAR